MARLRLSVLLLLGPLLLGLAGCPSGGGGRAVTGPPTWLPADTIFYAEVNGLRKMKDQALDLALVADRKKVAEKLDEAWEKLLKEAGSKRAIIEKLLETTPHARVALTDLTIREKEAPDVKAALFLGSADVDSIKALAEEATLPFKKAGEPVAGTTILGIEKAGPVSVYLAKKDKEVVLTTNRSLMADLLKAMGGKSPKETLAGNKNFKKLTKGRRDATTWGYLDGAPIVGQLEKMQSEEQKKIQEAFGTFESGPYAWSSRFSDGGFVSSSVSLHQGADANALHHLITQSPGPRTLEAMVPKQVLFYANVQLTDPKELWTTGLEKVEELRQAFEARGPSVMDELKDLEKMLNVSIEKDIVGALRGEVAVFLPLDGKAYEPQNIVVAATTDRKTLEGAIKKFSESKRFKDRDGKVTVEDLPGGAKLHNLKARRGPGLGFLLDEAKVLIGTKPELLKKLHGGKLNSISESKRFQAATRHIPAETSKFAYLDLAPLSHLVAGNLSDARKQGNEASAIGAMRTLISAQGLYREAGKSQTSPSEYAKNLKALGEETLIDSVLSSGTKNGYKFSVEGATFTWKARANPVKGGPDARHFFTDQSGVIRFERGKPATEKSPPVGSGRRRARRRRPTMKPDLPAPIAKYVSGDATAFAFATVEKAKRIETYSNLPTTLLTMGPIGAAIAIPNLIESRKAGNEAVAIGSLKVIISSQGLYRERNLKRTQPAEYAGSLEELGKVKLIDAVLSTGVKAGYRFSMDGSTYTFTATAAPVDPSQGDRYFYVDQSGVVRFEIGRPADEKSRPLH